MILEDIVESTKERVETNKKRHSIYELKEKAFAMPIDQSFPFKKALKSKVETICPFDGECLLTSKI